MRLTFLFYILALLLVLIGAPLVYLAKDTPCLLWTSVALLLTAFLFLIYFYRKIVIPMRTIVNGMDLLRELDFSSRLAPIGQREADLIIGIFNRMMNQLKEERLRLREQNHFLDLLINVSPMGVVILTLDGNISMMNAAAMNFLDIDKDEYDRLKGRKPDEMRGPLAEAMLRIPRENADTVRLGNSMIYRCSHLSFIDRSFPHSFFLIESLTDEVVKAEKKAYEKVIRMIAHEVNNTTAGVTSALDTTVQIMEDIPDTDDLREVMRVCVERCYAMSRFITNFADVVKIPEARLQPAALNDRVLACKVFMEDLCQRCGISLHLDLCDELPKVMLDTVLFEQVLVNIIKNAAESIGNQGDIYIRTYFLPESAAQQSSTGTKRPAPVLEIADTGAGIAPEVEQKLFTPFFSTKTDGQGIGLTVIRDILMKHRCTFSLRTSSDGITRFRIVF